MIAVVALLLASGAPIVEAPAPTDEPLVEGWASASEGYRLRTDGHASDNDVSLFFDGGGNAFGGRVGLDVSGAVFDDVDGIGKAPRSTQAFPSVHDAFGTSSLLVDQLELRAAFEPWLPRLSVGRLTADEGTPTTLDGAAARVTPLLFADTAWSVFATAGRTVHFFAVDDAVPEDWTASLGADAVFSRQVKLQVDWRAFVEDSPRHRYETSYGAAYLQRVGDAFLGKLWARGLDDELSHVGARLHFVAPLPQDAWRAGVDGEGIEQTATLGEVFEGDNPFFAVLGPSEPNLRGSVDAWARVTPGFADAGVHVGAAGRTVLEGAPGPFNRDFARAYVALDVADVVVRGPFASMMVSYDAAVPRASGRTAGIDPAVLALGGTVGYDDDIFRAAAGTSWDRTKYTYYRDVEELVDARTIFASVEARPWHALRLKAQYTIEIADRVVHTVALTLVEDVDGAL